jgi:4-amino-4-deoxy-L-arabinose transferase-like glycosyltransferase
MRAHDISREQRHSADLCDPAPEEGGAFPGRDIYAVFIIIVYCIVFGVLRLAVSSTMDLDDAEQFLNGASYRLGYPTQPPLYSWIVRTASLPFGMSITVIVVVKYCLMALFYLLFYRIARAFWNARDSLLVTASLLVFYTYSYDFNRHLSHSVLVSAAAALTLLLYMRLLRSRSAPDYFLLGVAAGIGVLSKYNFGLFLGGLFFACVTAEDGRKALFSWKTLLAVAGFGLVLAPHVVWLFGADFPPVRVALEKANAGEVKSASLSRTVSVGASLLAGIAAFLGLFALFFRFSRPGDEASQARYREAGVFRRLALFGVMSSFAVMVLLRAGHFSIKWLAPVLFVIPLALFPSVDLDRSRARAARFGCLCLFITLSVFVARAAVGFFPDAVGKVERIHTPFRPIVLKLAERLNGQGMTDRGRPAIVTDSAFMAGNITADLPGEEIFLLDAAVGRRRTNRDLVLVWNASADGLSLPQRFRDAFPAAVEMGTLSAPYLHSKKSSPFLLGVAVVKSSG